MSTHSKSTLPGVGSPLRLAPASNFERMYVLDEAWNAQDWETFDAYHDQDVVVYCPAANRRQRWGCLTTAPSRSFVTQMTGAFTGPLELPDGTRIEPTSKSFDVSFATIARWRDGKIVEEYLKYDNASFMQQVGLA